MAKENGVKIEKTEKTDLEKALDGALNDLQKAATGENLEKSEKKDEEKEESKDAPFKGAAGKGDGDEKKDKGSAESEDEKGDKDEDPDEKARKDGYRKGVENDLTKSAAVKNAVEVSKFLGEIVKSLGEIVGDMRSEISSLKKSNANLTEALVKSFGAQNEITKSLASEIGAMGGRPMARKSVDAAKVKVLEKSQRGDEEAAGGAQGELTKSEVASRLATLEMDNKVPLGTTSRYEAAGLMSKSVESIVFGEKA